MKNYIRISLKSAKIFWIGLFASTIIIHLIVGLLFKVSFSEIIIQCVISLFILTIGVRLLGGYSKIRKMAYEKYGLSEQVTS